MEPVTIRRHGDRWAVHDPDSSAPDSEYKTRQIAEVAARDKAGDREVVIDETPRDEGLAAADDARGRPSDRDAGIDQRTGGAGSAQDTPREPQAGL